MRAAARVARPGDPAVLEAILCGLRNPGTGDVVVTAACEALARLAPPVESGAADRVHALLEDRSAKVRCAALRALPSVVPKGDARAVRAILDRADNLDEGIRESAMIALGQVVLESDSRTISRMIRGLRDGSIHVRRAAVEALQNVSDGHFSAGALREDDDAFSKAEAKSAFLLGQRVGEEEAMYRSSLCFVDAF